MTVSKLISQEVDPQEVILQSALLMWGVSHYNQFHETNDMNKVFELSLSITLPAAACLSFHPKMVANCFRLKVSPSSFLFLPPIMYSCADETADSSPVAPLAS